MHTKGVKIKVNINISVYLFEEDNCVIAYCPSLDLSGYGSNRKEAKQSFDIVLKEYLHYCMSNNTLLDDLKNHGWAVKGDMTNEPAVNIMLRQNSTLKNVLQKPRYSKFSKRVAI